MSAFCNPEALLSNVTEEFASQMGHMKSTFTILQIIFCLIGVIGNILNLRTLQSPSLQTVPFMYIRSLAFFDLISLSAILLHFILEPTVKNYFLMIYSAYIEAAFINTFLVAGLYCAFMLTVERCLLIARPHLQPASNPRKLARRKILAMLGLAAVLHLPMMLQNSIKLNGAGSYHVANNVELLCREPHWTVFNYYKMVRECLRFFFVTLMTFLNVVIARKLQLNKIRRRRLVRRSQSSNASSPEKQVMKCGGGPDSVLSSARRESNLVRSFSEKKLTVLMVVICVIFILGNLPQMLVMVLQNEAMDNLYGFQLYRNIANLLEVVNHCLNFYVFCMASSEYTRAFLLHCVCLRNVLLRLPQVARFLAVRRSGSMVSCNMSTMGMQNNYFCSGDSLADNNASLKCNLADSSVIKETTTSEESDTRLKGILITGDRTEGRGKKSLTIVNHLTVPLCEGERTDTAAQL
ncbi:G protein-coupled receptor rhodopsin family and GPCR rhodopsin 7TM domain-containing protein [Trichostrongylus colubriformis]|uniref:G protein-coupled receptor rhodopsin family and GPCR rhodopsin 7TM domain-containing protein n=1 Tax=Trichostrongylus colubriformis TaxID=6319 RepID=A0AAN8FNB5_TRICO